VSPLDVDDLWEHAPCGHLITDGAGRILRVNATVLAWLGYEHDALRGTLITDLLSVGGRIHYETHFAPLLAMTGDLQGVTVDMVGVDGTRRPMFLTANVKTDAEGNFELLRITAVDATDRRAYERELLAERTRAEAESARARAFAETLRRSLLPPVLSPPSGLDAADYYYAASTDDIGGDFYDLFPVNRSTWGFFLGDVIGKGVDAAVVTGLTRYVLRSAAVSNEDPVAVLGNLNSVLAQHLGLAPKRTLSTLIYGNMVRAGDGFDIELASGGHLPPLLLGADGSAFYADTLGGQAVGMVEQPRFVAHTLHLNPGDTMVLYTDGLTEALTGIGRERFDDDGALLASAKEWAPASAQQAVREIRALLDSLGTGVQDDAAVLAFGVPLT
jgi:sigma-B regulation protein RsbU (phosphoserine phosphatase)